MTTGTIDLTLGPITPIGLHVNTTPIQLTVDGAQPVSLGVTASPIELSVTAEPITLEITGVGAQGPAGPEGPAGPGAEIVLGETPSGIVNGSNATFTTAYDFVPGSVTVRVNGLGQRFITDFNTSGTTTILMGESPQAGDSIQVDYIRG